MLVEAPGHVSTAADAGRACGVGARTLIRVPAGIQTATPPHREEAMAFAAAKGSTAGNLPRVDARPLVVGGPPVGVGAVTGISPAPRWAARRTQTV